MWPFHQETAEPQLVSASVTLQPSENAQQPLLAGSSPSDNRGVTDQKEQQALQNTPDSEVGLSDRE